MANVFDVAQYILESRGEMTTMKLQKLVYYSQAWHLAWTEHSLFPEPIEAWKDGPVCPALYQAHKGFFRVSKLRSANSANLTDDEKDSIDRVLGYYGDKSPQWLSDLTHLESPWIAARRGANDGERSNTVITPQSMCEYYAGL